MCVSHVLYEYQFLSTSSFDSFQRLLLGRNLGCCPRAGSPLVSANRKRASARRTKQHQSSSFFKHNTHPPTENCAGCATEPFMAQESQRCAVKSDIASLFAVCYTLFRCCTVVLCYRYIRCGAVFSMETLLCTCLNGDCFENFTIDLELRLAVLHRTIDRLPTLGCKSAHTEKQRNQNHSTAAAPLMRSSILPLPTPPAAPASLYSKHTPAHLRGHTVYKNNGQSKKKHTHTFSTHGIHFAMVVRVRMPMLIASRSTPNAMKSDPPPSSSFCPALLYCESEVAVSRKRTMAPR